MIPKKYPFFLDSSLGIPYIVIWFNVCNKELLALRNNFRVTKKFVIAKFDCTRGSQIVRCLRTQEYHSQPSRRVWFHSPVLLTSSLLSFSKFSPFFKLDTLLIYGTKDYVPLPVLYTVGLYSPSMYYTHNINVSE